MFAILCKLSRERCLCYDIKHRLDLYFEWYEFENHLFPLSVCVQLTVWALAVLWLVLYWKLVSKYLDCFQKLSALMLVAVSNIYLWLTDQGIKVWLTTAWGAKTFKLVTEFLQQEYSLLFLMVKPWAYCTPE